MVSRIQAGLYILLLTYYAIIPFAYIIHRLTETEFRERTAMDNVWVLVTGGAGYIGSHTIVELLKNNYSVVAIDNLANAYKDEEDSKPESLKRVETITGRTIPYYNVDIKDRNALERLFKLHKFDGVIHFAALKGVGESVQVPLKYYQNNICGSTTLFEVMLDFGVKKMVFSSSATVYGTPAFLPLTENHPTGQGCTNPYGKTKYFVEEILRDLCTSDKEWKVMVLRYFNPVGAHESGLIGEDPTGVPNNLMPYISQVAVGRRESLKVYGSDYDTPDGTGIRDYIHITDLALGHVHAMTKLHQAEFQGWKAYNLGTGRGYSVFDMIKAFKKASGREVKYEVVERRDGDVAVSYADPTVAEKELNWHALKDIDDMCRDTWNWQINNPNGFNTKS